MKPAVARWLEFAEIDLKAAKVLFHKKGSFDECASLQQEFVSWTTQALPAFSKRQEAGTELRGKENRGRDSKKNWGSGMARGKCFFSDRSPGATAGTGVRHRPCGEGHISGSVFRSRCLCNRPEPPKWKIDLVDVDDCAVSLRDMIEKEGVVLWPAQEPSLHLESLERDFLVGDGRRPG